MGIPDFNDKCRYVLLKYIRGERTPAQAEEQVRLDELYAHCGELYGIKQYLLSNGYIASDNNDPMTDEKDNDIYTTEEGIKSLSNGIFPSETTQRKIGFYKTAFELSSSVIPALPVIIKYTTPILKTIRRIIENLRII
jgi:hypothetical protein